MTVSYHDAPARDIEPVVLYRILKLRADVFIVEQEAAYPDLDGRDLEPEARQLWAEDDDGEVVATLRLLHDGEDRRIGRVATAEGARGQGHAGILMQRAVDDVSDRLTRLDAQDRLESWYGRFGFVRDGETFYEDGIPHVPMTRPAHESPLG